MSDRDQLAGIIPRLRAGTDVIHRDEIQRGQRIRYGGGWFTVYDVEHDGDDVLVWLYVTTTRHGKGLGTRSSQKYYQVEVDAAAANAERASERENHE